MNEPEPQATETLPATRKQAFFELSYSVYSAFMVASICFLALSLFLPGHYRLLHALIIWPITIGWLIYKMTPDDKGAFRVLIFGPENKGEAE